MTEERAVDIALLKRFTPLMGMKQRNLASLAGKVVVRQLEAGRVLLREGDVDSRTYWIVSGTVELRRGTQVVAMISGGSDAATLPLVPSNPRVNSVRAVDNIEYLAIESELLDVMITWDQTGTYEVVELQAHLNSIGEDDWMSILLQNRVLQQLPPQKLQSLFGCLQRVPVAAGETIIRQGDEGDYFYALVSGRAVVLRETPLNPVGIRLAELGPSDTFGEEALIAETNRNATVRMLSNGVVMRLRKPDFAQLLADSLLHRLEYPEASDLVARGALWLDVRLPSEHLEHALAGAISLPLYFLRLKLSSLDRSKRYVVYCDDARRSSAAAFILVERGIDAYVLNGGISSLKDLAKVTKAR
jgi:CRP-like cAMP-binding protein